jgi:hypothetical protein
MEGTPLDAAVIGTGVARVLQLCDALKIEQCPKPEKEKKPEGEALPDDISQLSLLETPSTPGALGASSNRVEVLVVNSRGAPNVTSLQVIRAEDQGIKELDEITVIMHLAKIQQSDLHCFAIAPFAPNSRRACAFGAHIGQLLSKSATDRAGLSGFKPVLCPDLANV